jgi:type IV pilus assembly protein PilC
MSVPNMLYRYRAIDTATNEDKEGSIEAANVDVAINALQRRKYVIVSIVSVEQVPFWEKLFSAHGSVKYREVVILSRQVSTLFKAQVSALRVFQLLSEEQENETMRKKLDEVADDLQGGMSVSAALGKHPDIFSDFYVNMVAAGEESGNLSETFQYLADYMDRNYELIAKTRNALIYPAFVVTVFIIVMVLMLVVVIPKLSAIIVESGAEMPIYTKFVIGLSNFMLEYGLYFLVAVVTAGFFAWQYARSEGGKRSISSVMLGLPYIGDLYRKLYLARIADNLNTMLTSGIAMVRAVEVSASTVGNQVYRDLLFEAAQEIRTGVPLSHALGKHEEIPGVMVQMVRVGEETGEVGNILATLAKFYKREVDDAIDTLIGMIEPAMIILLGVGVGGLLTSVLMPIYNISASI